MEKQKHHYVPKVYLREFSKNKSGHFYAAGPKPDYLKTINPKHVEQVCYAPNFYTLKERTKEQSKVEDIDFLEKKAFDYEKRLLPRIISKLKHKNVYLNKSYHDCLIEIYLNLKQRNLSYRHSFRNHDLSAQADKQIQRMNSLKSWVEEMTGQNYSNFMGKIKEQILQDKDLPDELHKQTLIETARGQNDAIINTKEALKKLTFYVLEQLNSSDYFLTSDNPGFTLLSDQVFNTNFGRFDSIGFPINSKQTIYLKGRSNQSQLEIHKKINYVKLETKSIELLNFCTIFISNENVFCESKKYLTELVQKFEEHQKSVITPL